MKEFWISSADLLGPPLVVLEQDIQFPHFPLLPFAFARICRCKALKIMSAAYCNGDKCGNTEVPRIPGHK
jgi:hypothetical protein